MQKGQLADADTFWPCRV